MTAWTSDELDKIGKAEELQLASLRGDGTLQKPVIIWVVRLGEDLYIRSYRGRNSTWFRNTQVCHEGHIWVSGIDREVAFLDESNPEINAKIDAAYLTKYRHHDARYVNPMVTSEARAATIKLIPRSTGS